MNLNKKVLLVVAGLSIAAIGATQIKQILKIVGVGAAVQKFGPDINKSINKLSGHTTPPR